MRWIELRLDIDKRCRTRVNWSMTFVLFGFFGSRPQYTGAGNEHESQMSYLNGLN